MGNEQARVGGKQVKFVANQVHQYLGNVQVYKTKLRSRQIASVAGKEGNKFDIYDHTSLTHPNLINLLTYDSDLQELMGLRSSQARFYFDLYHTTLRDVINQRKVDGLRFCVYEIQRLLTDILSVLSHFETKQQDVAHWNISPESIFYDQSEKCFKVYDNEIIQGQMASFYNHFQIRRSLRNSESKKYSIDNYITPEIAQALYNTSRYDHLSEVTISKRDQEILLSNKHKLDIYQLGLTLLETVTYLPSSELYNTEDFTINTQELERRIKIFGNLIGHELEPLIRKMLSTQVSERSTATEILKSPFIQSIIKNNEKIDLLNPNPQDRVYINSNLVSLPDQSQILYGSPIKSQVLQNYPQSLQGSQIYLQQSQFTYPPTFQQINQSGVLNSQFIQQQPSYTIIQQQPTQVLQNSQQQQPINISQQPSRIVYTTQQQQQPIYYQQQLPTFQQQSFAQQPSRVVYTTTQGQQQPVLIQSQIGQLQNLNNKVNQVIQQNQQ
ncbi:Protein kinase-like domain [Pseudocohnilembus persalinus]|uniref:non-specific serine/threonine protein kinase n=1 Tax=Pseudocohnilembus persalinus TaxID=266149 RepID=A0A0V0R2N4_PSEPJ|nr:Protein kinase-like domain [Pseudocohnilembus persalinus]|eukprot:KRX08798.1 Protein kinase-like domain [Pseudocohnilembus persalinus]